MGMAMGTTDILTVGGEQHATLAYANFLRGEIAQLSFFTGYVTPSVDSTSTAFSAPFYRYVGDTAYTPGPTDPYTNYSDSFHSTHGISSSVKAVYRFGDTPGDSATAIINGASGSFGLTAATASSHQAGIGPCSLTASSITKALPGSAVYDNWFVQHSIPQSDSQYMWITSSMQSSKALGYATASDDITFLSSSDVGSGLYYWDSVRYYGIPWGLPTSTAYFEFIPDDFVGLNTNLYEPVSSSINTVGYPLDYEWSASIPPGLVDQVYQGGLVYGWSNKYKGKEKMFNGLMHHRNGPYQYPSWKQIRTGESPIIRNQRQSNIMSYLPKGAETVKEFGSNYLNLNDPTRRKNPAASRRRAPVPLLNYKGPESPGRRPKREAGNQTTQTANAYNSRQGQVWHLTESVVTSKYHPLIHEFGEIDQPEYLAIADTYGNNMGTFTAENITTAARAGTTIINDLGINVAASLPDQFHTKISEAGARVDHGSDELVRRLLGGLPADQQINHVTYRETVFPREQNTYLKKVRQRENFIIDFWRPSRDARTEIDVLNSQGNTIAKQSMWPLDGRINPTVNNASVMPSSDNAEGEMQNRYSIDHGGTPASPGTTVPAVNYNRAGAFGTGSDASYSVPWETAKQAGKDPFYYDSYDECPS